MKKTHDIGEKLFILFLWFYVKLTQIRGMMETQNADKEAAYGRR